MSTARAKSPPVNATLIAAQVDELGALEKRLAPYRADLKRVEALRKAIRQHFDGSPAGLSFEPRGDKFFAMVGARANERSINPVKLIKAIGVKLYAQLATIGLGVLEANVAPDICAAVISTDATGPRPIATFERQPS